MTPEEIEKEIKKEKEKEIEKMATCDFDITPYLQQYLSIRDKKLLYLKKKR